MTAAHLIHVERFTPEHLDAIRVQAAQLIEASPEHRMRRLAMAATGPSFTATDDDGRVLLCAGMVENHPGYATAWALLGEGIGAAHLALTRATRRVIDAATYARIDMIVRTEHAAGHDWARLLGFRREGTFRRWAPDGGDVDIYARIRGQVNG